MKQRALVMGLGLFGGGVATTRHLVKLGYDVTVTDLRDAETLAQSLDDIADLKVSLHLGDHHEDDFRNTNLVVKSPAVRMDNALLEIARQNGAKVSAEIVLFSEACAAPIIGVTGSNGKTSTAHMLHAILAPVWEAKGAKAWLGGNLGRSLLSEIENITPEDVVILELSSFQLMDLSAVGITPQHAIITNITPNHLDWHKDMAEYVRAKASIFLGGNVDGSVVLNAGDEICRRLASSVRGKVLWFGADFNGEGVKVSDHGLEVKPRGELLLPANGLAVPGRHNLDNAASAATLARALGVDNTAISKALKEFRGVVHRLEFVREVKGVRYFNDSIATTPESTMAAIRSFSCPTTLLLGGSDKKISFDNLANLVAESPQIRRIYLNGPVSTQISDALHEACKKKPNPQRALSIEAVATFDEAIERAHRAPIAGSVFLMSPSCASFYEHRPGELFRNFEHRGEHFKGLVRALAE